MGVLIENRSQTENKMLLYSNSPFPSTTTSVAFDTAGFPEGVCFGFFSPFNTPFGESYSFVINEDDDISMASATPVEDARLTAPMSSIVVTDDTLNNTKIIEVGVVNVKRYVNVAVTSIVGGGQIIIMVRSIPNSKPVTN